MPTYERSVRVRAPLEEVWAFHSRASGLEALTPDWMRLRVEATVGPDGEDDPEVLEAGSRIVSSVRPFGVGPRQRWVSEITAREEVETGQSGAEGQAGELASASFTDEMVAGPFREWVHTHAFFADGEETVVSDRVEYALPRPLPACLAPLARVGLEPMFRYRHRKTVELLEG